MSKQTISIIGQEYSQAQSKGPVNNFRIGCKEVSLDIIRENLSEFINDLGSAFDQITAAVNNYELDEIEVKVDVTVSGGIRLIGSVETGMDGGVILKFKRKDKNE